MPRTRTITAIIAAGLGALAISVAPAIAAQAQGPGGGTASCNSSTMSAQNARDNGVGNWAGQGRQGQGQRAGMNGSLANLEQGTLTAAQKVSLAAMAEEEKLAHDVYVTLAAQYPDIYQFSRIAPAETQHQSQIQALLSRYGLSDPTANLAVGQFQTAATEALYNELVASATSTAKALAVGVTIEKLDIADLKKAISSITAPDVLQVYTNLIKGSERHLAAFSR
ncbi:MAG: DUF2202 domain-containing protein [Actinomycetota bacterium]|nr:DUF2202 domain-containing protein [Actinomycetota bacterium]